MRLSQLALILCLPLFGKIDPTAWSNAKTESEEESFFLRRIADFWQEGEYDIAKTQMEEFLSSYPNSPFSDLIRISLGDILLREKNYSGALASYSALSSPDCAQMAFLNRMQCLYGLEWYSTLADECETALKSLENEEQRLKTTFYLAIALYHQCLNASKDSDLLLKIAKRAEPYFATLLKSELSSEVSQAFAHLCCILKEYQKAVDIYLDLASRDPLAEDEMTFQAALIQAEYDKKLALQSFERIAKKGEKKAKDAAYNHLILSFEAGLHDQIVSGRAEILAAVPEERKGMAHLFIGRSSAALGKWSDAIDELTRFLKQAPDSSKESIYAGLVALIESAHHLGDVTALDTAIAKLSEIDATDGQVAKGRLLKALLLKNAGNRGLAREELEGLLSGFPDFPDRAAAAFEWADLEYQAENWEDCRSRSLAFLEQFPKHELSPFAWRYLAASSERASHQSPEFKKRYSADLERLLQNGSLFSKQELCDWKFYLAQAYFNLGRFDDAISTLQFLLYHFNSFPQEGNAQLLLGLSHRDGKGDLAAFCLCAEKAIEKNANLMDPAPLHVSLFNAYLELSKQLEGLIENGADHLYKALEAGADISRQNLLWLGDRYAALSNPVRASRVLSCLLESGFEETAAYRLASIYSSEGRVAEQIDLLEQSVNAYKSDPNGDWKWEKEVKLLLAEGYESQGLSEKATLLLNEIAPPDHPIRSETVAKAYLQRARIHARAAEHVAEVASEFKDLILQRRLVQEPVHLEAGLDYVDLLAPPSTAGEKRLLLLEKIKKDFESADDLLSKDYHQARTKYPEKNRIFENYMKWIDQEILLAQSDLTVDPAAQKELQAKAKDLLLQIKCGCSHPTLLKRVCSRLNREGEK